VVDVYFSPKLDHFPLDTLLASFPIAAAHTFRFSHTDLFTLVSIALRVRALHLVYLRPMTVFAFTPLLS
jgi:hypothetical protein